MAGFAEGYVDVAERIVEFYNQHPDGSLRAVNPERPYWFEQVDGKTYLVYAAAAYRTPDDPAPGIGVAWEVVPGTTSFTRTSELMNAETSAWGRALVALGIAAKRGIASKQEVRSAQERNQPAKKPKQKPAPVVPDGEPFDEPEQLASPEAVDALIAEARNSSQDVQDGLKAYIADKKLPALSANRETYPAPLFEMVDKKLCELQDKADGK